MKELKTAFLSTDYTDGHRFMEPKTAEYDI